MALWKFWVLSRQTQMGDLDKSQFTGPDIVLLIKGVSVTIVFLCIAEGPLWWLALCILFLQVLWDDCWGFLSKGSEYWHSCFCITQMLFVQAKMYLTCHSAGILSSTLDCLFNFVISCFLAWDSYFFSKTLILFAFCRSPKFCSGEGCCTCWFQLSILLWEGV